MANVSKILDELVRRLTEMKQAHEDISRIPVQQRSIIDSLLIDSIDKWTRGTGSSFGALEEFDHFYSHRYRKNRIVESAKGKGDVVIGREGDPFAKTIQSKAVTSEAQSSVEEHIDKAIEQIAGLYHESARKNDHLSVSVVIFNDLNPWPFTKHELRGFQGSPPLARLQQSVLSQVTNSVTRVTQMGASNATNTLKENLSRRPYFTQTAPGAKTRALYRPGPAQIKLQGKYSKDIG